MDKYLAEFFGTFFLMLTIVVVLHYDVPVGFAIFSIGLVLIAVIYAGGPISKAHYNPAITLAFAIRRKIAKADIFPYILAQFLAVISASYLGLYFLEHIEGAILPIPTSSVAVVPAMIAEFLGTFLLAFVILQVATSKRTAGNEYYGIAIGFAVMASAFVFGPISRSAINPAVAFGMCLTEMLHWSDYWLYILAACGGAAAAAGIFRWTNPND